MIQRTEKQKQSHSMDMTKGAILKNLLTYAVPLVLANFFQLTYNAVDSMIVSRYIGKNALAAVGAVTPVMNFLILGVSGLCIGASVIMSTSFGAHQEARVKKELATLSVFGLLFSVLLAAVGIVFAPWMLTWLQTPPAIRTEALVYMRIVFLGVPFTFFYNALSGAMKSVGDSATPLKFIVLSSVINGALDWLFIGVLRCGIAFAAVATVAAEGISVLLCVYYINRNIPLLKLQRQEYVIDGPLLRETLHYGIVTALQQACQPLGKLFIQGSVNAMGVNMIAAYNTVSKIDDFAFIPEQNLANAMTTFIAQNRGAGETARVRKGLFRGLLLEVCYWMLLFFVMLFIKRPVIELFTDDKEIIEMCVSYIGLMSFFYVMPAFTNGIQGYFRGMGRMKMTLLGTFIQIFLRAVCIVVLLPRIGLDGAAFACVVGWGVMLLVQVPYAVYVQRKMPA